MYIKVTRVATTKNPFSVGLRKVHLQIYVDKALWLNKTVIFQGRRYCLTWLGFGLNEVYKWLSDVPKQDNQECHINVYWWYLCQWKLGSCHTYLIMDLYVRIQRDWKTELKCWACRSGEIITLSNAGRVRKSQIFLRGLLAKRYSLYAGDLWVTFSFANGWECNCVY